jgi:hypothetical protein
MHKDTLWVSVIIPGNAIVRLMRAFESFSYIMRVLTPIPFRVKLITPLRSLRVGMTTARLWAKDCSTVPNTTSVNITKYFRKFVRHTEKNLGFK